MIEDPNAPPPRALVTGVQLPNVTDAEFDASLQELRQLARTLGYETVGTFTQKRTRFDPAAYFGVGKREEIRRFAWGEPEDAAAVDDEQRSGRAHV